MTWKPDICIYHGNCDDGFGAAFAVWKRWGDTVQYVPASYGKSLGVDVTNKHVLFADFSLKRDHLVALESDGGFAKSIVVIDHHKTAQAELMEWTIGSGVGDAVTVDLRRQLQNVEHNLAQNRMEGVPQIIAFFDMHKSGARMAWEFCHPERQVPALIAVIEDRDLWRFNIPSTRAVSAALRTLPHDFRLWLGLSYSDLGHLVIEGEAILRGHEKNIRSFLDNRYWTDVGGHRVPVVNVPYHYASDTADALLKAEPEAPFAACWFRRGDGKVQWSLRSDDDRIDVSEVAKAKGGGGHRNAAGFEETAS